MKDSLRKNYNIPNLFARKKLRSEMKPYASKMFCNAVRSRIIKKLPDGQILIESPEKTGFTNYSDKAGERPYNFSQKNSSSKQKRKQISSYANGAYASMMQSKLLELLENLPPKRRSQKKSWNSENLLSTPCDFSQNRGLTTDVKASMVDLIWSSPTKLSQKLCRSASKTPLQMDTSLTLGEMPFISKQSIEDSAAMPLLMLPPDIDFNDKTYSSPVNIRFNLGLTEGSNISRFAACSNMTSEFPQNVSARDYDTFHWQPRSPYKCRQSSLLL